MIASLGGTILCVSLFNIFIDPLNVFASPHISFFNTKKPHLDHHRELSRYREALRLCANAGIFGNSRAEIGFDPEGPTWNSKKVSVFNYAIPGTGITNTHRQLLWLQSENCSPREVFLGVEFFDFLGGSVPEPLPTLQTDPVPQLDSRFFAENVLSITGLRDSISTILLQWSLYPALSTERGFNPLLNYTPEVAQNGHYALFRQRAEENIRSWKRKPLRLRLRPDTPSNDEVVFDAVLSRLNNAGATTYIIIYPYHAQFRLLLERLGMGGVFSDWKRTVVTIAEKYAKRSSKVEIWDFSGISPETLEAIPEKGDRKTHLNYFWEAGHFKRELGEQVIARILGGGDSSFGIRLDSSNLENWLEEDRRRVQETAAASSWLTREIDNLLAGQTVGSN